MNEIWFNTRKELNALPLGSTFFNQASVRTNESMIKKKEGYIEVFKIKIHLLYVYLHYIIFFIQLIILKHLIKRNP